MINIISDKDLAAKNLTAYNADYNTYEKQVKEVLNQVREQGDEAVFAYTKQFDGSDVHADNFLVTQGEIDAAYDQVEEKFIAALRKARGKITAFHQKQLRNSWLEPETDGTMLGQLIRPLKRVGIYVPGGTASYPSSVLMNAIPAQVAGVKEIVMVTPPIRGTTAVNPYTLVAAREAGVEFIYKMGGAQAVGALAYGTQSVSKVDKITGPGNIYVTLAKKLVYGEVDIDMLAGPSEIVILADQEANPVYIAADLLSQAEHDVLAASILVTPSEKLAHQVKLELARQLAELPRQDIARQALENKGAIVLTDDILAAIEMVNHLAPEHLELLVTEPFKLLGKIENAGAIFIGPYSPEPIGDYMAGPNHVLPTGGTAKFYSPLNVDTFLKKSSVIYYSAEALLENGRDTIILAEGEGLMAHANAVRVRLKDLGGDNFE
ncbi:MAG: histidinol dehydrogenase [Clostridia bacterium]|jgi:histidinol dehydrogenase|nr:histidinol dehydrogenase [Clostridia bacterium]